MLEIAQGERWIEFSVSVTPRSHRDQPAGVVQGALKLKLRAAPVEGEANKALIKLLAKTLGVSKSSVNIVSGQSSRRKRVRIAGLEARVLRERLGIGAD